MYYCAPVYTTMAVVLMLENKRWQCRVKTIQRCNNVMVQREEYSLLGVILLCNGKVAYYSQERMQHYCAALNVVQ
jgi:hypothetical protein